MENRNERYRRLKEYAADMGTKIKEASRLKKLIVDETTRKTFFDYMLANGIGEGFGMSLEEKE